MPLKGGMYVRRIGDGLFELRDKWQSGPGHRTNYYVVNPLVLSRSGTESLRRCYKIVSLKKDEPVGELPSHSPLVAILPNCLGPRDPHRRSPLVAYEVQIFRICLRVALLHNSKTLPAAAMLRGPLFLWLCALRADRWIYCQCRTKRVLPRCDCKS